MRFPFGRGARQREIDSLRPRIAELQDEITRIEESLAAESSDVETTDAYRSVQVLRESMRREEIAALRQELRGLEARLETLTVDRRRRSRAAAEGPRSGVAADSETAIASGDVPQAEAGAGLPSEFVAEAEETEITAAPAPARTALAGHGLPSERAIIEPPPPQPSLRVDAQVTGEPPAMIQEEPADGAVESEVTSPPVEEMPAGAAAEPEEHRAVQVEAEPVEEPAAAREREAAEPVAVTDGGGSDSRGGAAEAAPEPVGDEVAEAAQAAEAAPAARRSRATLVLIVLVTVAILAIAAVAALESGLIDTGIGPAAVPTALPTRQPPIVAPPTARPTTLPSPAPSVTPSVAAAPGEEAFLERSADRVLLRFQLLEQGNRLG